MVRIAFVVEGGSEVLLIKSDMFKKWAQDNGMEICQHVINARGESELCNEKIHQHIESCIIMNQTAGNEFHLAVLTDLECNPCFTYARERIGNDRVKKIFVARKTIEAWFLADCTAMRAWIMQENRNKPNIAILIDEVLEQFSEPEYSPEKPWDCLKRICQEYELRGPGDNRKMFVRKMLNIYKFNIVRAANNPSCPSANYFINGLLELR